MKKKNEIKDELEKLSPFLSEIKKGNAFKVPKNYFNSLPDEVLKQVQVTSNATEQSSTAPSWLDRLTENIAVLFQPKFAVGFATALLLIVATFYFTQESENQISEPYQMANQYIEENIDEFDTELLWEASVFEDDSNEADKSLNDSQIDDYFEEIIDDLDDSELEKLL